MSRTTGVAIGLAVVALGGIGLHFLSADEADPAPTTLDSNAPPPGPAPEVEPPWRIAVLPFRTEGSTDADVGDALTIALAATLGLADGVDGLVAPLPDGDGPPTWNRGVVAADSQEATHFVIGELDGAAGALRVHATLHHSRGAVVREMELRVSLDELLEKARDLALGLLGERTVLPAADTDVAYASSTRSLTAMRAFVRARHALEAGDDQTAVDALAEALEADPQFSLAAFRRGEALERLGNLNLAIEAVETALGTRDRLGRADLERCEALIAEWRGDYARALPLLRAYTTNNPNDVEGWIRLGEVQARLGPSRGRPPADSQVAFERALELDPTRIVALERSMELAADAGDLTAFDELVERVPEVERPRFELVSAIAREDAVAIAAFDEVVPARGPLLTLPGLLGHLYLAEHDEPGVEVIRAEHDLAHGRPAAAMERLADAWESLPPFEVERIATLLLLPPLRVDGAALSRACPVWSAPVSGLADAEDPHAAVRPLVRSFLSAACAHRLGHDDDALATAVELRGSAEPHAALGATLAAQIEAWIALDAGEPERALTLLVGSPPAAPAWQVERSPVLAMTIGRWVQTEAHVRLDQLGEALHIAQSLPHPAPSSRALQAVALLKIAGIYLAAGRRREAQATLERFFGYREDSEPAFAREIAEARAAVAADPEAP